MLSHTCGLHNYITSGGHIHRQFSEVQVNKEGRTVFFYFVFALSFLPLAFPHFMHEMGVIKSKHVNLDN